LKALKYTRKVASIKAYQVFLPANILKKGSLIARRCRQMHNISQENESNKGSSAHIVLRVQNRHVVRADTQANQLLSVTHWCTTLDG
jgi:hypothetical protein